MKQEIIYESHSTSQDNENRIASGHLDPSLSELGKRQAIELGRRYIQNPPDILFCSDLKRSYETAQIALPHVPRIQTSLLREWDYGIYNGRPVDEVESLKSFYIRKPFPEGESLESVVEKILIFLDGQLKILSNKKIMIVGHRSTYYALEHRYHRRSLELIVSAPWTWRKGWTYY
jgi:broad specificity phosphatase PhoE